jgi:hypothetical protein
MAITLAEELSQMSIDMESGENPPSYHEVYMMILRAMLEIRQLNYRIRFLEGKEV